MFPLKDDIPTRRFPILTVVIIVANVVMFFGFQGAFFNDADFDKKVVEYGAIPYEISHPGGSIEHMNEEAGAVWIERLAETYSAAAWLNPTPEAHWSYSQSTLMLKRLMKDRMYPLTLDGLDDAMRTLSRKS